ncbi:MAG: type II secretion system protein GspN [Myxococcales bacterium]|nr:type II secretion system protein GspN [Myxococcales bacterium]MCB9522122.1 type II secretion system protein GspN [Myxococcales bacterium]
MGRLLKNALRWGAYTVFLLAALAFFVYLTLPVDEIKAYLVRKAADEHQMQLDITELKVAGLGGVELRGVTITPMPTPEEREALARAQEARKAWREAKKAAEAAEAEGGSTGDDATGAAADEDAPKGKAKDTKAKAAAKADGDDGEGADDAAADAGKPAKVAKAPKAKDSKPKDAKAAEKKAEDEPPPLPPAAVPIFIERLSAKVAPFKLMRGAVEASVDAELMGGRLAVQVAQGSETLTVKGDWEGLSIEQLPFAPKRKKIVIDESPQGKDEPQVDLALIGALEGDVDLEVPLKGKKPELSKITGSLTVRVVNALLGPGQIFSRDMGFFDVPRIRMAQVGGGLRFEKRKATFEDFKLTGKDLEGDIDGHIQLADSLKAWGPRAHLRFKFSEEFLKTNKDVNTALKGLPKIRRATDPEGFIGLQVTGSLKDVKTRLTKTSVYRKAGSRRSATKGKGSSVSKGKADDDDDETTVGKKPSTIRRGNTASRTPRATTNVAARKPRAPMIAGKTDTRSEPGEEPAEPDEPEEEADEPEEEPEEKAEVEPTEGEKPEAEGDGEKPEGEEEKPEGEGEEGEKPEGEGEPEGE